MSIRLKVILPFLLLTLVIAVTGLYVVTRLVTGSLYERLTNQLLEAGRVVSDDIVRQEIQHVDAARIVAHTRGLAEAITSEDTTSALTLASPLASGLGIENLILVDKQGREITHLILTPEGQVLEVEEAIGAGNAPIVRKILETDDPESLPQRGIGINLADGRFY